MADVEKSGAVFKVLAAKDPVTWNKLSFWTKAEDTQFDFTDRLPDANNNVQFRLGEIYGITSDIAATDRGICASSYLVNYTAGEKAVVNISKDNWSTNTVHINEADYLYQDIAVESVILSHPVMYLIGKTGSIPTDDEKDVFTSIEMETVGNSLRFYIENKPDISIDVGIKGIVLRSSV